MQFRELPAIRKNYVMSHFFASSSGATCADMLVGKSRTDSEIKLPGIRTDLDPNSEVVIFSIANSLAERLGMTRRFQRERWRV